MSRTFIIKRGDTSPALRFALDPDTIDITGSSCSFQMRPRRGSVSLDAIAVIESALPPIIRYNWAAGDTNTSGIFEAEFRVTYSDGSVETFPNDGFISVLIKDDVR